MLKRTFAIEKLVIRTSALKNLPVHVQKWHVHTDPSVICFNFWICRLLGSQRFLRILAANLRIPVLRTHSNSRPGYHFFTELKLFFVFLEQKNVCEATGLASFTTVRRTDSVVTWIDRQVGLCSRILQRFTIQTPKVVPMVWKTLVKSAKRGQAGGHLWREFWSWRGTRQTTNKYILNVQRETPAFPFSVPSVTECLRCTKYPPFICTKNSSLRSSIFGVSTFSPPFTTAFHVTYVILLALQLIDPLCDVCLA